MVETPHWVRHAIFYQIFPDRFAKSERVAKPSNLEPWEEKPTHYGFKGGDLIGVVEHLDYLQDLGINAIYLCPIFQSTANHRYHTHDYYRVDPILGGDAAFRALLDEAHRRDIRVIIDGVFNHASRGFYQFNHALENGAASPYLDWFYIRGFPLHAYEGKPINYDAWWGIPALPKLNTRTPAVREFIFDVAQHWIRFGADGWRLDVPAEIDDDEFWREFRRRVKTVNPDAYLVGEIWHPAQRWLQGDQFDAVMNYQFAKACIGFFVGEAMDVNLTAGVGYAPVPVMDAPAFGRALEEMLALYDENVCAVQMNLLDSHDTARFLSIAGGDVAALKLATLCQMTFPGAPSIYYGDEIGMRGGKDPDCRRAFIWDEATWDIGLRDYFKQCIALRRRYRALRDGGFNVLFAEGRVIAYLRARGDEKLIVALNSGPAAATMNIVVRDVLPEGSELRGELGERVSYTVTDGVLRNVSIPKRKGVVLRLVTTS
ncbi:MAG: alpha-amylase [Chloroflexi bacterium]|jgi:glycosidase|uniref:Alpha-amylase n=1 Tax=Candidatus Thermofonsia Clade 3 bacterium TaxID=2364212 RepID=A0A2M8QAI3_9CHLR|nr:alpha-amylase family glycosyl hydrolase [Candidatus Roseilinea sp. NK_OTU-006]PJF46823.1 MAG: alpha-amylase [Candidatus Thermofonsia Clade 3 bacterium]RMG65686.1 MAG: alpha-amylase [Chloroflexota bacterium]